MPAKLDNLSELKSQMADSGRLVLLRHTVPETVLQTSGRGDHFDLMLDPGAGSELWTWALDQNIFDTGKNRIRCDAQRLPDHRRTYLDFEGQISGARGHVKQLFSGTYTTLKCMTSLKVRIEADPSSPLGVSGQLKFVKADDGSWEIEFQLER